jgi:TolB-like protein/Tfp pilus assembly protein PilF
MDSFFAKLKKRNVFRVVGAYLVIAWLLLQVGDTLFSALKLGESANSFLVAFLALGFIPTVIFSWVYELTPEGIKKESEITHETSIAQHTAKKLDYITIAGMVLLAAMLIWNHFKPPAQSLLNQAIPSSNSQPATDENEKSIAVLPFEDMSSKGDQEYFGDGISEELLNVLAKTKGLRVAARTSSFKFKGTATDIPEIGKALNVKTVLEGSIRKSGDNIRITAQLINVKNGFHIWSGTYDRELKDIFKVQDEIAFSIVEKLKLELDLQQEQTAVVDIKAYEWYLKGRKNNRLPNKESSLIALEDFRKAIAIDPQYASAYAGVAVAWIWLEDYGGYTANEAYPQIEANARKALSIDDSNSEALMAMGKVYQSIYDDSLAAGFFYKQAIAINPSNAETYTHFADALDNLGQQKESLFYRKRAIEIDPLSTFYRARYAGNLASINLPLAMEELGKLFEMSPNDDYGLESLAGILISQGEMAKSIGNYIKVHHLRPGDPYSAAQIAMVYDALGVPDRASYWLKQSNLRGINNRWAVYAQAKIAINNADWNSLIKASESFLSTEKVTAMSWMGYAYLGLNQPAKAKTTFLASIPASQLQFNQIQASVHYSLIGLKMLATDIDTEKKYQELASRIFQRNIDSGDINFGYLMDNAYFNLASTLLSTSDLDGEQTQPEKAEILSLISKAVESGFRDPKFLTNNLSFKEYQQDNDFLKIVKKIKKLNQITLEKLKTIDVPEN